MEIIGKRILLFIYTLRNSQYTLLVFSTFFFLSKYAYDRTQISDHHFVLETG